MLHIKSLIFTAVLAIVMIAFIAFAKNLSKGLKSLNRKAIFRLLFISFINAVIVFLVVFFIDSPFVIFWIFCFVYLAFGIISFVVTHQKFIPEPDENKYAVALGEMLFSIAEVLFVSIIFSISEYVFKDKGFLFYPVLLSGLSFIVPLFFYHTFESAIAIPATDFHVWQYPSKNIDPPEGTPHEKVYVIGFNIPRRMFEKKTEFRARAPENITLGDLFYHFINEYNDKKNGSPIEYADAQKQPIVWWFRLKRKWYQFNKVLDPSLRVRDNFIQENSVIICEQLSYKPIKANRR